MSPPDPSLSVVPSSTLSAAALAALFTRSFEGYSVPMTVDEATYLRMAELFDFDLDVSRVALRDDRPIGLVNVGLRGPSGWIGGMGVVPSERRSGVGERLMRAAHDVARARGVRELWLEVITSNAPAIGLYEKLGYERVRELEIWSLDVDPGASAARETTAAAAHERVRALRRAREPWQRADRTLERVLGDPSLVGLVDHGAAAVVRLTETHGIVEQVAGRDGGLESVLAGALERARPLRLANIPADGEVSRAFARLGGEVVLQQLELRLELQAGARAEGPA